MVGDSGVGKTALLLRFAEDKFDESPTATLDEDYKMKQITVDNQRVKLQIWYVGLFVCCFCFFFFFVCVYNCVCRVLCDVTQLYRDTAGQERFRTVTSSFYRAAKGTLLVFDISNANTFNQAQRKSSHFFPPPQSAPLISLPPSPWNNHTEWVQDIRNNTSQTAPLFLIGNKTDLGDRKVTADQAKEFAKTHRLEYYETSAKSGAGVTEAFTALCRAMIGGG